MKVLFGIFYFLAYRKVREASAKRRLAETMGEGVTGLLDAFA